MQAMLPPSGTAAPDCEVPIDPALLVIEQSQSPSPTTVPKVTRVENEDKVSARPGKIQRLKATEKATKYGLVNGVMRGNMVYSAWLFFTPNFAFTLAP